MLNLVNMPFLDLGDKPQSYNPKKNEGEQIFVVPRSELPTRIIVTYSDCKPIYGIGSLKEKYVKSKLRDKGITYADLEQSVMRASFYQQPYRGHVSKLDKINLAIVVGGLFFTIALSMSIGISIHWSISLAFILAYFIYSAISIILTKRLSNRYLRQAHFMLAVYCRSENNRLFLKRNVEMRPGFLGKWIEYIIYD